jgi:hypothetical protein
MKGKSTRSLVPTILTVAILAGAAILTYIVQHRSSEYASAAAAATRFDKRRAEFARTQPLVDMAQRRPSMETLSRLSVPPIHAIHTLVFDTRGNGRLVQVSSPFWIVKLLARSGRLHSLGELTFLDDTEFDPEPIDLSLEQIARHGPGPLVDFRHPSGGQFFSWTD